MRERERVGVAVKVCVRDRDGHIKEKRSESEKRGSTEPIAHNKYRLHTVVLVLHNTVSTSQDSTCPTLPSSEGVRPYEDNLSCTPRTFTSSLYTNVKNKIKINIELK